MKTKDKINLFKGTLLLFLILFQLQNGIKAQVSCSHPIFNNLPCSVDITFEYIKSSCNSFCSGPQTITCPGFGTTTLLTPVGCGCAGAWEIAMNITDFGGGNPVSTPLISVYGGCSGIIPTSDSGSYPSTWCCPSSCTYSFAASPTGATVL